MTGREKAILIALGAVGFLAFYNYRNQNPADTGSPVVTAIAALFSGNTMQTSQAGRDAIVAREGDSGVIYADAVGYLTGGIGHKLTPSDGSYSIGDTVTIPQRDAWFSADVTHAENIVKRFVSVPMTQNAFDAMVSAAFNLGSALFRNSDGTDTHFMIAVNNQDWTTAQQYLLQFNHAGGQVVAGLTIRRASEAAQMVA